MSQKSKSVDLSLLTDQSIEGAKIEFISLF